MDKKKHKGSRYKPSFFLKPFPPNHNPLIGVMQVDTMNNIFESLVSLQEMTRTHSSGMYFFLCCIVDALDFEMHHRQ